VRLETPDVDARIASAVSNLLESPTAGSTVTLIVGVAGDASDAAEQIEAAGGEVEAVLPYSSLAVSVDETGLSAVCSIDQVESVEIEKEYSTRNDSDFCSRSRSMT